ncbi:heme-binding-like protein At3g10130, chloroplastic [Phaseolus vulgaris]|uniref:Uncharacterized protein n=1 Tax=Phaseolus vulgaris TaxID=3885 RepID=V7CA24_PHAVU|nr:hypothetical protein PHAVU_003G063000g [Phaseolus vulgaris]ESW25756.1 hypothetical protein PHAVU_003G063000g [Phaseolus vulgaris]
METAVLHFLFCFFTIICWCSGNMVQAIQSPNYTLILSESDFQIRLYNESTWISARVSGTSFDQSYKLGFQRLYQYIHGANSDSSKIAFTAPALTSVPWSSSSSGDYTVRMFIPSGFEGKPPVPNPELKLRIEKWKSECIAVRKFSGYAKDDNINKEMEALVTALNKQSVTIQDTNSYIIANYNASSHNTTQRLNEVWINVSGLTTHC